MISGSYSALLEMNAVMASLAKLEKLGVIENEEARAIIRSAISRMVVAIKSIEARLTGLETEVKES